jgi:hypothetical protein
MNGTRETVDTHLIQISEQFTIRVLVYIGNKINLSYCMKSSRQPQKLSLELVHYVRRKFLHRNKINEMKGNKIYGLNFG